MSEKQLEISVHNNNSLLIKDYTMKKRWEQKSEQKVFSDDIYLPGYESKPIKIGVYGDVSEDWPYIFIENSDIQADDVTIHFAYCDYSPKYGKWVVIFFTFKL